MAIYKVSSNDKNMWRSDTYRFTVASKDDLSVVQLKADVARRNKIARELLRSGRTELRSYKNPHGTALYRVRLMARGTRRDEDGMVLHPNADCCLNHEFAKYFDVYVVEDTTAEWQMQRELDTGLTPGQLKRVDRENYAQRQAELEMIKRLQENGIVTVMGPNGTTHISAAKRIQQLREAGMSEETLIRFYGDSAK